MIGYYVHHVGRGHLRRATAFARHWEATRGEPVTGLSSLDPPGNWPSSWVTLPSDACEPAPDQDVTAGGRLHWVPLGERGLLDRAAALSSWVRDARPRAVVVDVSVEVALLVRLHGLPVVSVVLPGHRTDSAHLLGLEASTGLVAAWPEGPETEGMTPRLPAALRRRLRPVGGLSSVPVTEPRPRRVGPPRAVLLQGRGGDALTPLTATDLEARTPGWQWTVLGGAGTWSDDPAGVLMDADVVVTSAGQGSLADVASLRRPCIVVPETRPHDEQVTTGAVLAAGPWPAHVVSSLDDALDPDLLEQARTDDRSWHTWCDGLAPARFSAEVDRVALRPGLDPEVITGEAGG